MSQFSEAVVSMVEVLHSKDKTITDLVETLKWVRANYAAGSTEKINARIEKAIAKAEAKP